MGLSKKIFISYVEEDGAVAHEIAAGLESQGYSSWLAALVPNLGVAAVSYHYRPWNFLRSYLLGLAVHPER